MYFREDVQPVDWASDSTVILPNPRWQGALLEAGARAQRELPRLSGHVWIASSGSSASVEGALRWVALSRSAFLCSARAVNEHVQSDAGDVWVHALPTFHVGGLAILARAAESGARVVAGIVERWDPAVFCALAQTHHATLTALVPTQLVDLVQAQRRCPPLLRAVFVGGASLDPQVLAQAQALGWPCLICYGASETCSQIATAPVTQAFSLTQTMDVLAHAEVRVDPDEILWVKGDSLLSCYAELPRDAPMRVYDPKQGGWLKMEDLAVLSGRRLTLLGRASESLKIMGEKVFLSQVEQRVLASLRHVQTVFADAAVVAVPHARLGHELILCLSGASGGPAALGVLNENLQPFERLSRVVLVETIPRTALGKCQRALLAQQVEG